MNISDKRKILKKTFDTPDEYILEALEDDSEEIFEKLYASIPSELLNLFNKYMEIQSFIEDKRIEIAYYNGQNDGFQRAKGIILEKVKKVDF